MRSPEDFANQIRKKVNGMSLDSLLPAISKIVEEAIEASRQKAVNDTLGYISNFAKMTPSDTQMLIDWYLVDKTRIAMLGPGKDGCNLEFQERTLNV